MFPINFWTFWWKLWLCDSRLTNDDALNFVRFFLEHPLYSHTLLSIWHNSLLKKLMVSASLQLSSDVFSWHTVVMKWMRIVHWWLRFAGAFLTISLPDFYRYVKQLNAEADVPNTAGDYSQWKKLPLTQNEYVHEIYGLVPLALFGIAAAQQSSPLLIAFILYVRSF